jgi:hypothetical protein
LAQEVGETPHGEHEAGGSQKVGQCHPEHRAGIGLEDLGEYGEGDIHDARVHGSHEGAYRDHEQGHPLVGPVPPDTIYRGHELIRLRHSNPLKASFIVWDESQETSQDAEDAH